VGKKIQQYFKSKFSSRMCVCHRKEFRENSNLLKLLNENACVLSAGEVLGCLSFTTGKE
jgi:hypothetical protein